MIIGVHKETRSGETRVGLTTDAIKKLTKKGYQVCVEHLCGANSGFLDVEYQSAGAKMGDAQAVFGSEVIVKLHKPVSHQIAWMKKGTLLISMIEPFEDDGTISLLAQAQIEAIGMELIPRISRAQSMDVLSSQAGIAGYRAVIEAASYYGRFFPLMMTSAGSSKAAQVMVLGAGVAGLQAIATAKRLGAQVEAYDVRSEVKEQIQSLGAKFVELNVGEEGAGKGGYAKELSEEAKRRQQLALTERLKKCDIVISTANIPGRKAPVLITEEAVKGMRAGSVIVDLAAGQGGNCPLSQADQVVVKNGVTLIGWTNYAAFMPADASSFYANNCIAILDLVIQVQDSQAQDKKLSLNLDLKDEIIAASLVTYQGNIRLKKV